MEDSATSVPPSVWASLNSWFTSTVFFVLLNLMIATILFTSNLPNNNHHQQEREREEEKQNSQNHHKDLNQQPQIARSSSMLQRLKSFNFLPHRSEQEFSPDTDHHHHHHQDPLQIAASQYVFNQQLDYQHFDYDFNPSGSNNIPTADAQFSAVNPTHEAQLPDTETRVVWEHQETVETVNTHFNFDREEIRSFEEDGDESQSLDEVYSKLKSGHVDRTKSDGNLPPKPATKSKMKKSASLKVGFRHLEEVEARRPETVKERKSAARVMEEDDVEVDSKADDFINKFKNDLKLQRMESIFRTKGATVEN